MVMKDRTRASLERELATLRKNLNILEGQRAQYGIDAPLRVLNAIDDHHQAIELVEAALREELDTAELQDELAKLTFLHERPIINIWLLQGPLEAVGTAIRRHWPTGLVFLVLEAVILGAYLAFKDRYLIAPWQFWVSTVLLLLAVGFWSAWLRWGYRQVTVKIVSIVSAVALVAVLGGSIYWIARPEEFPPHAFGIAVARFGEGPKLKPSLRGQQISHDLIEKLGAEAQRQEALTDVRVGEVGIIKSSAEAKWAGQRIGADLVIWGRLVVGEEGAVTVHFEVLEAPASALNPEYPRVLPIGYEYSAEVTDRAVDIRSAPHFDIKETIASQSNAVTYFVLGLALYLERDFQEAILKFEQAKQALETEGSAIITEETQKTAADPGLVHYYLGKSYQMLGRTEKAKDELEKAAQLNGRDPAAQLGLAYSYRSLERMEDAEAAARKAVALCEDILLSNPRSEEALYDLGLAHQMLKEYDEALDAYLRVIEVNPDFHIASVSAGRVYALQGDFDRAIEKYHQAIEKAEKAGFNGAWTHVDLGDVYLKQGDAEPALKEYLIAVELEPNQDWMHFRLGQFYEAQGETDAAWQEYHQLVEVSANQSWANAVLGAFLRKQKLFDLAIESYKRARLANPEDTMLSVHLGETYLEKYQSPEGQERDAEGAEEAFDKVLGLLPEDSPGCFYAYAPRGRLYFYQQRFDLAIADFLSALEINPQSVEIQFSLARAYDAHGDVEEAISAYEKILDPEMDAAEDWVSYAQERLEVLRNR
jgi:tetratricopeptide (TPR) repeat protein